MQLQAARRVHEIRRERGATRAVHEHHADQFFFWYFDCLAPELHFLLGHVVVLHDLHRVTLVAHRHSFAMSSSTSWSQSMKTPSPGSRTATA
jgi:hypothetical protein